MEVVLGNLLAWGLQVAAIAALGLVLPVALGLRSPAARLVYLRGLLLVCLVLPLVQPWVPVHLAAVDVDDAAAALTNTPSPAVGAGTGIVADHAVSLTIFERWPLGLMLAGVYLTGLGVRLGWTALGLLSLARLRRTSVPLLPRPESIDEAALLVGQDADFRVSERVVRPATFGLRRPVVLVPPDFVQFPPAQQMAVAAHELLHVRRRDWVRALADGLLLSVCWFHPVLWWLVEQIHLSIEQVVDRQVVSLVGDRKPYLEALLKLASAGPAPLLQPASLFLKHGHLAQRVALLVREASMSRVRLVVSFVVAVAVLVTSGVFVVQALPLKTVLGPAPIAESARADDGTAAMVSVGAARIAAEPAAQQTRPTVDPKMQASKPGVVVGASAPPPPPPPPPKVAYDPARRDEMIQAAELRVKAEPNNAEARYTLGALYWERSYRDTARPAAERKSTTLKGIAEMDQALRLQPSYLDALVYKNLLVRQQAYFETDPGRQQALIAEADELRNQALKLKQEQQKWDAVPANALRVGGEVRPPVKVKDVKPVYPAEALEARVQGVVIIEAVINEAGAVQARRILRSIPLLDQAAMYAVGQWEFSPTLLNGVAVPVVMTVTVNFTLGDGSVAPPPPPPPPPPAPTATGDKIQLAGQGYPGNAVRIGGGVRPPVKTVDVRAVYPPEAKAAGTQGVVILELLIRGDGTVQSTKVLRSIPELDQAAIDAASQWEFSPTLLNGVPVPVVLTVTVNFTLQ